MLSDDNEFSLTNFSSKRISSIIQAISIDRPKFSGFLKIRLNDDNQPEYIETWNLFFSRGKIVFSGFDIISFENILSIFNNYLPTPVNSRLITSEIIQEINDKSKTGRDVLMIKLLGELALSSKSLDYPQFIEAIQSHIIIDTEKYLFRNAVEAELISNKKIDYLRPILGLQINKICSIAVSRKAQWSIVKGVIPSLDYQPKCDLNSSQWKQLSIAEKTKIRNLVGSGNTLEEIRYVLGEDNLKIAQIFSKLVVSKLVTIGTKINSSSKIDETFITDKNISKPLAPKIVIIDDSSVLLKQISSLIESLGYRVECCNNALKAVDMLLKYEPKLIFIDINMPELSGFQLMKQIRTQTKISSIPLVILTAEKSMLNQQRAKWSKSSFLSKPLSAEDKKRFVMELKILLQNLVPIAL